MKDIAQSHLRNSRLFTNSVGRHFISFEQFFLNDRSNMVQFYPFATHAILLMIIRNFHFMRMACFPLKTETPLLIDSDAVLPLAITHERIQVIS